MDKPVFEDYRTAMGKHACQWCGEELPFEFTICCSGLNNEFPCGCMGLPIEPPICSDECWKNLEDYWNKNKLNNKAC